MKLILKSPRCFPFGANLINLGSTLLPQELVYCSIQDILSCLHDLQNYRLVDSIRPLGPDGSVLVISQIPGTRYLFYINTRNIYLGATLNVYRYISKLKK